MDKANHRKRRLSQRGSQVSTSRRNDNMVPWSLSQPEVPRSYDCGKRSVAVSVNKENVPLNTLNEPIHITRDSPPHGKTVSFDRIDFQASEDQGYSDIGDACFKCLFCNAIFWSDERSQKSCTSSTPDFSSCCMKGKVILPSLKQPPTLLLDLFNGDDPRSANFLLNIRMYNSMFAFTSLGGKIDSRAKSGRGPPQFIISGQNYHRIGTLLPCNGQVPKFAQLYVYDTNNETENRLSAFSSHNSDSMLDSSSVDDLIHMMDENNVLAKTFRRVRDFAVGSTVQQFSVRLFRNRKKDPRTYNLPTVDEVAALIVGDFDNSVCGRDVIVRSHGGEFQRIHETHTCYLPLQYPMLFPYGEDGYHEDIKFRDFGTDQNTWKRKRVSLREFISYRLHERLNEESIIFKSRRLFQQLVVDCYSMIESQRLSYIRNNQSKIRQDFLSGVQEAVDRGDTNPSSIGSRIVLPSSFVGGRRYMFNNCQDAMAICRQFGYPDLFITLTCNPKWPKIQRFLLPRGLTAQDRPDITCRVFRIKLDQLMKDFRKGHIFGHVVAGMYTIEFQKRGLPHAHILLWLEAQHKLTTIEKIDAVISVELPAPHQYPNLYKVVSSFMVHGPCGATRPHSPCMQNGKCSKFFPKKFAPETTFDQDGYPIYRRRNTGISTMRSGVKLDNRYVVPFSPMLLMRYQAHINIECCNKSNSIKYLFKYINKGVDRVTISVGDKDAQNSSSAETDEIKQYYDCRYLSPCEAAWRICAFDIHHRWPSVQKLTFHLPGDQMVVFKDWDNIDNVLNRNRDRKTMFQSWMEANERYDEAKNLTYTEFPNFFVYDAEAQNWRPRQKGFSIGRMNYIPHGVGELYYLRLLLNVQRGPISYEAIRTVNGITYDSFRQACGALGLLDDDKEFNDAIKEASHLSSPRYLRKLFMSLLMSSSMSKPATVWESTWELMADDILHSKRLEMNKPGLVIPSNDLQMLCLVELEKLLLANGKTLQDFPSMPFPETSTFHQFANILIFNEMNYDVDEMRTLHDTCLPKLNLGQRTAYDRIIEAVYQDDGGFFFVYGHGGTGKTFLWRTLSYKLRAEKRIVLNVASSGIASLLLPGG